MPLDREAFFEVMASFPTGVAIVTTVSDDGAPRGLTTTAVCSVSASPPTILVCVDLGSRTLAALRARRGFVVNFMGEGRSDLCLLFASKAEDKFARVTWRPSRAGLPVLHEDVLAWAECSTLHELEVGDHVLLVAQVDDGGVHPELESPLMYYRRSWGAWSPAHESAGPDVSIPAIEVSGRDLRWQGAEYCLVCSPSRIRQEPNPAA
jgi:flavin reductase (DIM6/NTAB) family NADH-FMN oxidoreductase RutF